LTDRRHFVLRAVITTQFMGVVISSAPTGLRRPAQRWFSEDYIMRIAQVSPLFESVPPKLYGGTERIVHYLTEELLRQGHDVTLFASGDSVTSADLVATRDRAIWHSPGRPDPVAAHLTMLDTVRRRADDFDVIHFHTEILHLPLFDGMSAATLTTLHGRLDMDDLEDFYRRFPDMPLVSISRSQQRQLPDAHWLGTVHHGLPVERYPFRESNRGEYLAFLGRIAPEKGVDRAIHIAQRAGVPLRIAAKVAAHDESYFREYIKPLLEQPGVEYIGEIDDAEKAEFLGNAAALLFPVDWPEPFGLVMIEAMACGTPVIGYRNGAVPEIVDHEITGLLVDSLDEAVAAVPRALDLDRALVRERCERRFSVARMTVAYLALYRLLDRGLGGGRGDRRLPIAL
jgi:glycosyltransferase involved in cell wall biosynthesis